MRIVGVNYRDPIPKIYLKVVRDEEIGEEDFTAIPSHVLVELEKKISGEV